MSQFTPMNAPIYDPYVIQAIIEAHAPWPLDVVQAFDSLDFEMQWWICRWQSRQRMARLVPGSFKYILLKQDEEFYQHFRGARQSAMEEWRSARVTGIPRLLPFSPVDRCEMESFLPSAVEQTPAQQLMYNVPALNYNYNMPGPSSSPVELQPMCMALSPEPLCQEVYSPVPDFYASPPPCTPPSASPSPAPTEFHSELSPAPYRVIKAPTPPMQFTGDWEADAIANAHLTNGHFKSEFSEPDVSTPPPVDDRLPVGPVRPRQVKARHPRDSLPRLKISKCRKSPSPSCSGHSPAVCSPHHCVEKRGKPVDEGKMACLFCRGRKIACSSPGDENPDKTCNQCERRGLSCVYPTENRRGMRKRKCDLL